MDYEDDQRRRLRQQHQQHPSSLVPNRPRTMTAPSSSGSSSSSSHYYDPSQNFARLSMAPPVPVLPANLLPGGGGSGGKRLGQQSVYVDNASLLFGQARPDLPPSLARVPPRPPVLVPIPAGHDSELDNRRPLGQATMSSSSSSGPAPPPPLPLKPSVLRQTEGSASIPTFPPPNLPPKPFGSDLAPTSFYSAAVAPITPPLPLRSNAQDPAPAPPIPASIPAPTPVHHPPQPPTPAIPFHSRPPSPLPTTQTPSDEGARPDFTTPSRRPTPVSSLLPSSSSPAPPLHPHPPRVSRSPARSLPSTPSPRPARASPPLPPPMPLPPPQSQPQPQQQQQQQQQPASTPSATTAALAPLPRSASPGEFEYPFYTDEEARQMEEDEALARRLAAEEEAEFADAIAESPLGTPAWASSTSSASTSPRWPAEHHPASYTGAGAGGGGAVGVARRAYSTTDLPSSQGGGGGLAAVLEAGVPPRSAPMPNRSPNQFVEPELLLGVSFGFGPPPMNVQRAVMQSPIPTIISLPYGKAPPMHIQAGSWKQMLRLLAKLSGTRIEPAVESVAMTSGTLKLRVVVQFIKNHHASNDWRTVLYLTIDHPTPPKLQSSVVRPNDPNVLPFSYTLSSLPTLLRDGHDSSLSKYYAIPETPSMPLPHLPLTLPDLAVYLAGALEESRKVPVRDAAGGFKRLSKLVDAFYPAEAPTTMMADDDDEPRRGWKRFIRRSKQPAQQSVNANMYELVTPFPFVAMSAQTPGGY